jgi:emfourin
MRIEIRTHGDVRRPALIVETEDLPPADARDLERLAAALPAGGQAGTGDRYDVLVDDASGRRTASFFEPNVPAQVRALLRLAREARRRA